jgi:hypothetical protein
MCLHSEEVHGSLTWLGRSTSIDLSIENIQLDNYSETAIHPVLIFGGSNFEKPTSETDGPPCVLKLSILSEIPERSSTLIYKYIALRVLQLRIEVFLRTIYILMLLIKNYESYFLIILTGRFCNTSIAAHRLYSGLKYHFPRRGNRALST